MSRQKRYLVGDRKDLSLETFRKQATAAKLLVKHNLYTASENKKVVSILNLFESAFWDVKYNNVKGTGVAMFNYYYLSIPELNKTRRSDIQGMGSTSGSYLGTEPVRQIYIETNELLDSSVGIQSSSQEALIS